MKEEWSIAGMEIPAGEKARVMVPVTGTKEQIPATFINGAEPGKTLIVISGLHGGEYAGIEAAIETGSELNPEEISGQIILLHPLSLGIFLSGQCSISLEDHKNLNRIFPPDPNGTVSDRLGAFLWKELLSKADFCLDMHSGAHATLLYPHGYIVGVCSEDTYEKAKAGAEALDIPYFLRSQDETGAYNYAGKYGIPGLCVERGQGAVWTKENVDLFKKDIRNLMRHLGMLKCPKEPNHFQPKVTVERVYEDCPQDGCWYTDPAVKPGTVVHEGQKLGEIRDYFGNLKREIFARDEGVILILSPTLSARGGYVAMHAKFDRYI